MTGVCTHSAALVLPSALACFGLGVFREALNVLRCRTACNRAFTQFFCRGFTGVLECYLAAYHAF